MERDFLEITFPGPEGPVKALFDKQDAARFEGCNWRAHRIGSVFYIRRNKGGKTFLAHREVLGLQHGDGKTADHINRNTLDNRKSNLRVCTNQQNLWNRRMLNKTGHTGVALHRDGRFVGKIRQNGQYYYCGLHDTVEGASIAVNKKLLDLRGDFARLNEP